MDKTNFMKLEEAQRKLLMARDRQKKLKMEIEALKEILIGYDIELDQRFSPQLFERNTEIYELYKKNMTFTAIAQVYNLSRTRIASICHRMDCKKERQNVSH